MTTHKRLKRSGCFVFFVLCVILSAAVVVSAYGYSAFARTARCPQPVVAYNPSNLPTEWLIDVQPFTMPVYDNVHFPSRDSQIQLSGFYVPAERQAAAPTVIVVHGLSGCKRQIMALLPAGMLHRNGFNVLLVDLRNMGDSDTDNGYQAGGTKEYKDVLGAWDWLIVEKGAKPEQIGLFGYSLGGATVLIAAGQEQRIPAVWSDSAFADAMIQSEDLVRGNSLFETLRPLAFFVGRVMTGDDVQQFSPMAAVERLPTQSLFIVHGDQDSVIPVRHAHLLADAAQTAGSLSELWIAPDSQHVGAMRDYTAEYEERLVAFFTPRLGEQ
jgi:uncharacterized protein